jgi:putative endonuclease
MSYKKKFGYEGEEAVAFYLIEMGYSILAKNFSVDQRLGEVDIIAQKRELIIFVEVKTRKQKSIALVSEMVSVAKQKKIIMMAKLFLQKQNIMIDEHVLRFDIATIIDEKMTYFENAFAPGNC